jgi:hypothetical protein
MIDNALVNKESCQPDYQRDQHDRNALQNYERKSSHMTLQAPYMTSFLFLFLTFEKLYLPDM